MSSPRRRNTIIVILLLLIALLLLLWRGCDQRKEVTLPTPAAVSAPTATPAPQVPVEARPTTSGTRPSEKLGEATLQFAPSILAGAELQVQWTGPGNAEDYITIVKPDAAPYSYDNYTLISMGNPLKVTAPVMAGDFEVRYVTGQSKSILAREALQVTSAEATVSGPREVFLGAPVAIEWTGPNNRGDYVTIVRSGEPDGRSGNFAYTERGMQLEVNAPVEAGPAEIRYMTGQGNKVLARRPLLVVQPRITLQADASIVEGGLVSISFEGPTNRGDYLTVVPADFADGRYGNNNDVGRGSPLKVQAPMTPGPAEIRYMTAQGAKVLARRAILITPAVVTIEAPGSALAGENVDVTWTGPKNPGDYITIVPKTAPYAQVGRYADAERGSPCKIVAPPDKGAAEIRYISGQGRKILGRRDIEIK